MKRRLMILMTVTSTITVAACGGGDAEPAEEEPAATAPAAAPAAAPATGGIEHPTGPLTVPDWYQHDGASNTVHITLTAGETDRNNYWNYNGAINGELDITVPEGAEVTIDMVNNDPVMAHSVGVSDELRAFAAPPPPVPVFEGAITDNPTSITAGGLPGTTLTIMFVADEAGQYSLVCYVPGHSALGMWLYFTVSAGGEAGVRGL